jgi:hypothetical protein
LHLRIWELCILRWLESLRRLESGRRLGRSEGLRRSLELEVILERRVGFIGGGVVIMVGETLRSSSIKTFLRHQRLGLMNLVRLRRL